MIELYEKNTDLSSRRIFLIHITDTYNYSFV